jgi:hypothetical protein
LLLIAASHETSFVLGGGAGSAGLELVYPLDRNRVPAGREVIDEDPSVVGVDGRHLLLHGCGPIGIASGILVESRFVEGGNISVNIVEVFSTIGEVEKAAIGDAGARGTAERRGRNRRNRRRGGGSWRRWKGRGRDWG